MPDIPHVSICICTYQRPQLLGKLLRGLQDQSTEHLFSYSIVVVDNDSAQSAHDMVMDWKEKSKVLIDYYCEPRQNIALARNRSIQESKGNLVAMIDDDELPVREWLVAHYKALCKYGTDGVFGPVKPSYNEQTPSWLVKSGLCERPCPDTGKFLSREDVLRSGNVLLHRRVFGEGRNLFDAQFGLCGGEDIDFFERRLDDGFSFVWCAEAPVSEEIMAERLKFSFYTRKHTRMGGLTGEQMRNRTYPLWMNLAKSVGVALVYPLLLPFLGLFGRHALARNLVRLLYHASRIMGVFGFVPIRDR